ncbi:MAG: hypothetical protein IJN03_02140 [Bacilli bacterium]|nr:hypothetical protein [Bacilli bacterium]
MEIILNFLVDNYLWFLIISLILIFALIGYIVDTHEKKAPKLHFSDNANLHEKETDASLQEISMDVEQVSEINNETEEFLDFNVPTNDQANELENNENELL